MLDDDGIARLLGNVDSRSYCLKACGVYGRDRHVALFCYGTYVSKVYQHPLASPVSFASPGSDNDMERVPISHHYMERIPLYRHILEVVPFLGVVSQTV